MTFTSIIERLNLWGDHLARSSWPLFWQSSILIAGMFLLDLLLRRKLRPSVRQALWLVVLIKLFLPPSFAFPTGLAWWVRSREATVAKPLPTASYVVTYGPVHVPIPLPRLDYAPISAPPIRLSTAAWGVLATGGTSLSLLLLMLVRWRRLCHQLRASEPAPTWLMDRVCDVQRRARYRKAVRVILTNASISPALCGLFRPVIVLPTALVNHLKPNQLRAVLLHELFHLQNGDVWINCAQSLLQIVFWWHPLLWVANSRIRRIREEVVDDSVRLALGDEAETYAPTLLEVARLSLSRPLATLGLIGILESRHALKQRVDRLVSFPAPRRAGLTLGSILGILAFTCIAVPMGQAPAKAVKPTDISDSNTTLTGPEKAVGSTRPAWQIEPMTTDGWVEYDMRSGIATGTQGAIVRRGNTVVTADTITFSQETGEFVANGSVRIKTGADSSASLHATLDPQIHVAQASTPASSTGISPATTDDSAQEMQFAQLQPSAINPTRPRQSSNNPRKTIHDKLEAIRFDSVTFDNLPLSEVVNYLQGEARKRDPEGKGVNFLINPNADTPPPGVVDPATGLPVAAPQGEPVDINSVLIKISPPLNDVRMRDVLDAIVKVADKRIRYSIEDYGITFRLAGNEPVPLFTRTIQVDPSIFAQGLESVVGVSVGNFQTGGQGGGGQQGNSSVTVPRVQAAPNGTGGQGGQGSAQGGGGISGVTRPTTAITPQAVRQFFANAGVDLTPPKNILYKPTEGKLVVHAALADLDIVEKALGALSTSSAQPTIAAKSNTRSNPVLSQTNEAKVPVLGDLPVVGPLFQVSTAQVLAANSPQPITDDTSAGGGDKLITRLMKVNPSSFCESVRQTSGLPDNASSQDTMNAFRKILMAGGVKLAPPATMFYNERGETIFVRATAQEVETIEQFVQRLNLSPPQINIRAKFVEVNEDDAKANSLSELRAFFSSTSNKNLPDFNIDTNGFVVATLTDPEFRVVLRALEQRDGTDLISEQNVTTLSGREAQMQNVDVQSIIKLNSQALNPPGVASSNVFHTETLYSGPFLDIIPYAREDGDTLQLTISAKVTEFVGYDAPENGESVPVYLDDQATTIKPPHSRTHVRSLSATVNLHDGQTIVLGRPKDEMITYDKDGKVVSTPSTTKKNLFVFVTATLIDPAGNPIHSSPMSSVEAEHK